MKRIIRSLAPLTILLLLGSVITPPGLAARPASAAFPVKVETNKIMGKLLADSHGRTLYYLKTEKNGKIHCSGSCAGVWPPLLLPKGTKVTSVKGTSGKFATIKRPDGHTQITYNGWPVYRYSGDNGPNQTNGNGIQGTWFVAKVSLKKR
jgi:predicted lipoprotein with Yx(FWY)xxD motif